MKSNKLILILGLSALTGISLSACADDDSNSSGSGGAGGTANTGGSGGEGGAAPTSTSTTTSTSTGTGTTAPPPTMECGTETCEGVAIGAPLNTNLEACCPADNTCGVDVSLAAAIGLTFPEPCQERNQPSIPDTGDVCPASQDIDVMGFMTTNLPGCCRENGTCGYNVDTIAIVSFGLGCVESPFEGDAVIPCGGGAMDGGAMDSGMAMDAATP